MRQRSRPWVCLAQYGIRAPIGGQERQPRDRDGILYTSGTWGLVYAVDAERAARSGRVRPQEERFSRDENPCCDLSHRGVAVWKERSTSPRGTDGPACHLRGHRPKNLGSRHHHRSKCRTPSTGDALDRRRTKSDRKRGRAPTMGQRRRTRLSPGGLLETGAFKWRFYHGLRRRSAPRESGDGAAAKTWDASRDRVKVGGNRPGRFAIRPRIEMVISAPRTRRPTTYAGWPASSTASTPHGSSRARGDGPARLLIPDHPRDSWDFDAHAED